MLVARAAHQSGRLSQRLRAVGIEPVEVPLLAIDPPADDGAELERAVDGLLAGTITAIAVTSPNGAAALARGMADRGVRVPDDVFVACVGPGTARRVRLDLDVEPDLVATVHTTAGLAAEFPVPDGGSDAQTVLLPRADIASPTLPVDLAAKGWGVRDVQAYRTRLVTDVATPVLDDLADGSIAAVAAASPSTVEALVGALDGRPLAARLVSIGPVTSARARDHDLVVAAEADPHDLDGLVTAVRAALA